jgi:hypothetical protein
LGEPKPKQAKPAPAFTRTAGPPQEYGEECGGKGGVPYVCVAQASARITKVTVWHRDYVDGIQLETEVGVLPRIGATGMHHDVREDSFAFATDEFITGITVEFWQYVERLLFHTNRHSYGPFGGHGGLLKKALMCPPDRRVVGFKGRHWNLVDSIQLMIL